MVPVKLSNGESIVKGQTITSFTNAEEEFVKLTEAMPFLLETKLKDLGGTFVGAENFQVNVQVSNSIDYRVISPTFIFHHVINLSCHFFSTFISSCHKFYHVIFSSYTSILISLMGGFFFITDKRKNCYWTKSTVCRTYGWKSRVTCKGSLNVW